MEFKKNKVRNIKHIGGYQGQRIGEVEEIDESAEKVQNSNYKVNNFRGCNTQYGVYSYDVIFLKISRE